MRKVISMLVLLCLVCSSLVGCKGASSESSSSQNTKILFSLGNAGSAFPKVLAETSNEYAKENNIDLTVVDGEAKVETQLAQIKSAKADGYSAIICIPVNKDTAIQLIDAADGLPIVFLNQSPNMELLKADKYVYVGSDEVVAGQLQADFLAKYFAGKNSIKAVLLKGPSTHHAALLRTESIKSALKKAGIEVEYVFEDSANWGRATAKDMFKVFLKTDREFDCVISNNDEMALGVVEACKELGIDSSKFPIVGVDALPDAVNAISDGTLAMTILQSADGQSQAAVDAAVTLGKGKSISDMEHITKDGLFVWIPFEPVTKDNVSQYIK